MTKARPNEDSHDRAARIANENEIYKAINDGWPIARLQQNWTSLTIAQIKEARAWNKQRLDLQELNARQEGFEFTSSGS